MIYIYVLSHRVCARELMKILSKVQIRCYGMASLWNILPQKIKLSQLLAHFKNLMRKKL